MWMPPLRWVDDDGVVVARWALRRSEVLPFFRKLARPCLVGIETLKIEIARQHRACEVT